MNFDYYLANPTGNITILVETPVKRESQPSVALELMKKEPTAEQVGFIEKENGKFHLQMAGGEFCGNATMSAACVYALENNIKSGQVTLSVSGAPNPVSVYINRIDDIFYADVEMPKADEIIDVSLPLDLSGMSEFSGANAYFCDLSPKNCITLPLVKKSGIFHLICEKPFPLEKAEELMPLWCRILGADGLGFMLLEGEKLTPIVYVPAANTLFRESSCASGTTAVGEYLSKKSGKDIELSLRQPGGTLKIKAGQNINPVLSGSVILKK